jgi:hypothetical protein
VLILSLVLAAAPPAKPADALKALAAYGAVPPCTFSIARAGSRVRAAASSEPVASLRGKSDELAPFLDHPDRRVVERAAKLLCAEQDAGARRALEKLARRYPCAGLVLEFEVHGAALEPKPAPASCARAHELEEFPEPADWKRWRSPASDDLAKAVSAGNTAAVASAVSGLTAIDFQRQLTAKAALASVDTLIGWREFSRAQSVPLRATTFDWIASVRVGDVILGSAAAKDGRPMADEFLAAAKLAPDLIKELDWVSYQHPGVRDGLEAKAAAARADASQPAELKRWFESLDSAAAVEHPDAYATIADRLERLFQAKEADALRSFMRDGENAKLHRLLAGSYLAQLGQIDGLDLFADPQTMRSSDAALVASELEGLTSKTRGPVLARVKELLASYSAAKTPPHPELDAR